MSSIFFNMPASGPSVNGISAIKAFASTAIANRSIMWNASNPAAPVMYCYNSASTAAADDNLVLMPSDSPAAGRWIKHVVASGGGGITVDSQLITTITIPATGPIFPTLTPAVTPAAIGETRYVFRRYTVAAQFNGWQTHGLILTRSAYFTAIGTTAADWQCDRSGLIDVQYTTEGGNPLANDPFLQETGELRVEPDYVGQRIITRAAVTAPPAAFPFQFHNGNKQAKIAMYDTGLPVAGFANTWWEWGSWN